MRRPPAQLSIPGRGALVCAIALAACGAPVDTSWHDAAGYRWRELDVPGRGRAGFAALGSGRTGVFHRNDVDDEHALANRNLLIGAGAALGDIDGDGQPDLFLASVERPAALYHNDGDFRFTDVTATSGIGSRLAGATSATFADVNGDGHLDLIVGTFGGPLMLWAGDGKGRFTDATATSGFVGGYAVTGLTLADVEGDGDLDLYAATYKKRSTLDAFPPESLTIDRIVKKVGGRYVVDERWTGDYRVEDRPDLGGVIRSQRADPDMFFVNDGRGHFTHVPISGARFTDERGAPLPREPDYFTLAARFYDVNGDGAPDLYACNDFEDPDQFWLNDGRGAFRLVPSLALRETSNTCMSVDFGDVNRDGHVDFFTADMLSPTLAARQRQFATNSPMPKEVGLTTDRQQWMRNMLQVSRGDGSWADLSAFAGVGASDWTWGSAFVDVDLDGYEDLLTASGHRWDVRDADAFDRIRNSVPRVPWNREQEMFPRLATHSIAFRNNGDLTFSDARRSWRFGADSSISQGIALADLDGDGDLDVVVTRLDDTPVLYRNESTAPRVAVRLAGASPNTRGIGAVVTVRAPSLPLQSREITAGGYYLSGSDAQLAFAAGRDSVLTIEVRWRGGRVSSIRDARPNRLYEIAESGASAATGMATPATDSGEALFEDATLLLGGSAHVDSVFDDFRRQPLLPNRFSQLGPGVSWIDVDADGKEDLVVGTGRGGRLTILRNAGGRFTPVAPSGAASRWDLTAVLPVPAGRGATALVVGQSSYETGSPAEALSVPGVTSYALVGGIPAEARAIVPPDTASVGPLALGDVNGDGRLDLFVGARVVPGAWPLPAPSRIFLRTADGGWERDTIDARQLGALGLVSAALFTDLDGDGRPELVVTSEWGPLRVLRNIAGRLQDVTREWHLSGLSSRWNGLGAGDFDGDGRMDLVATSWGRNTPWRASTERPYELVVGNFGGQGLGLVFAQRDSAGREMPFESLERLGLAIPAVRDRIATFTDYARSDVDRVLGDAARSAIRVGATTFDHLVLLNRGDRFDVRSLPSAAQLAPAFAPVVADLDGDGNEDLFLAQNFFPTELATQRFDAGAGLVLLGDGRGAFRPLSVRQAGVRVLGDQRGAAAADFDGDGRVDLAVSQNGAPTTLWRNRRAAPGVRVYLRGLDGNPLAIGAQLRAVAAAGRGPARELHAGAGYWSMDAATTVLALTSGPRAVWVRWPGGREMTVPLAAGQRELKIDQPR